MWLDGKLPFMNMSHTTLQPKWTHSKTLSHLRVCNGEYDWNGGCRCLVVPHGLSVLGKSIKLHSWHSLYYHLYSYTICIMVKSHYRMAMCELESSVTRRWVDNYTLPLHIVHWKPLTCSSSIAYIIQIHVPVIDTNLRKTTKNKETRVEQLQTTKNT